MTQLRHGRLQFKHTIPEYNAWTIFSTYSRVSEEERATIYVREAYLSKKCLRICFIALIPKAWSVYRVLQSQKTNATFLKEIIRATLQKHLKCEGLWRSKTLNGLWLPGSIINKTVKFISREK